MTALFIVMSLQYRVYRSRAGAQQLLAGAQMAGEASLSTESGNRHWGMHSFIQDSQTLHLLSALRGQQDRRCCIFTFLSEQDGRNTLASLPAAILE